MLIQRKARMNTTEEVPTKQLEKVCALICWAFAKQTTQQTGQGWEENVSVCVCVCVSVCLSVSVCVRVFVLSCAALLLECSG